MEEISSRIVELSALLVYLILLLWIGIRSIAQSKTAIDYTLAGRQVRWYVVLATTAATMVGGGMALGLVGNVFKTGIGYALITCGAYFSLMFSGFFLAPKLRGLNLITVGDYFELRFGILARSLAVPICIVFLLGCVSAQMVAVGTITNVVLGIDYRLAVLIGAVVTIFYSTVGGLRAVLKTDVLQFVILVGGFGVAALFLVTKHGGLSNMVDQAQTGHMELGDWRDLLRIATIACAFFLGEMLVPPFAARCFIAKDPPSARWGIAGAGLFLLLFLPLTSFVLGTACNISPEVQAAAGDDSKLALPTLMRTAFHPMFAGVMIAALLAAVMSSADSCLSSLATIFMEDIFRRHVRRDATDHQLLRVAQGTTLFCGIGTAILALFFRDIIALIEFVYDFWGPTIVLPFIVGVLWYRESRVFACVISMFAGLSAMAVWKFGLGTPYAFSPALFGFAVAVLTFLLALPITRLWRLGRLVKPQAP